MAKAKNTSSAHSPEPWSVSILDTSHVWIIDRNDDYIAEIVVEDGERTCKPEHLKGNARLLAAAPKLLKAGIIALEHLLELDVAMGGSFDPHTSDAINALHSAIVEAGAGSRICVIQN